MHLRRHGRFYAATGAGLAAGAAAAPLRGELQLLLGGDVFFVAYLALMGRLAARITPDGLRARATEEDEGLPLILALTLAAVAISVSAIFSVMDRPDAGGLATALALASVPLGWAVAHVLAAFHYAGLFYAPGEGGDRGGLDFPGTDEPAAWDFLYFAFVIGMTAQVSDVIVCSTRMRQAVLAHGVVSFFYYAVILALAVNAAVGDVGG